MFRVKIIKMLISNTSQFPTVKETKEYLEGKSKVCVCASLAFPSLNSSKRLSYSLR